MNNECAKRRSVCTALLLLIRDLCMKLGAVILTGDFNKAVERETPSGDGERRISPPSATPTFHGLLQEEGQSGGTNSSEKRPLSPRKTDRFHDIRLLPGYWAHDTALDYADLFSLTLRNDEVQECDTRWDVILLSMTKISTDDVLGEPVQVQNTRV